jgi:hypothetical protein
VLVPAHPLHAHRHTELGRQRGRLLVDLTGLAAAERRRALVPDDAHVAFLDWAGRYDGGGALRSNGVEDISRVAQHEFGHVLGLDHPDRTCKPSA